MTAFSGDSHDLESPGFVVVRKVPLRNGKFQDRFRNAGCYISFGVKGGKCTFQILGGCQGRRTGVGVTIVFNSLILGGWVTNVLKNSNKK